MTDASSESNAPATTPDWAVIRQAYVNQATPVRDICRAQGIHSQTLYRRAEQESWPRRREGRGSAEQRRTLRLLARLRRMAESQIDEIETRRADRADMTSPNEPERDARALTALAKLIEHIAAIEAKHQGRPDGGGDGSGEVSHAERARRRAELANRLIAMLEQERGSPLPEEHPG